MVNEHDLNKTTYPAAQEFNSGMFFCDEIIKTRKIEKLIGREDELYQIIEILSRKTNNCPLIVGQSGVGKTAIIEEFAKRLVEGKCPNNFKGISLYVFNYEQYKVNQTNAKNNRFIDWENKFVKALAEYKNEIIVFIDNFEQITKEYNHGSIALEDILKPALEFNSIRLIGAVTTENYHKYIENNPSLNNKLQKIFIEESNEEETISILRNSKEGLENFHHVKILEEAIETSYDLSNRYINDKCQPQKSLSLLDEACALVKIENESSPKEIEKQFNKEENLKNEYETLVKENSALSKSKAKDLLDKINIISKENKTLRKTVSKDNTNSDEIKMLEEQLSNKQKELDKTLANEDYEKASNIKYIELPKIQAKLNKLQSKQGEYFNSFVTKEKVAKIVERKTGISVGQMMSEDRQKALKLKDEMSKRVFEQDEALSLVNNVILRAKAGVQDENKPLGSFLFLGPTGVGKTEIAKTIAEKLFDSEKALIRFDMSEYKNDSQIQRLIGAAPGYVGYKEGGQLTNAVKNKPYSVILFDEVEKAHPDIFNVLLQVLDDGRLTDSRGDTVDFKNTIIIMTSNLGAENINVKDDNERKEKYFDSAKSFFKPELLNRIDEVVVFNKLSDKGMYNITTKFLNQLKDRCKKNNNIELSFSDNVVKKIVEEGSNAEMGARPLKRYIQRYIETPLSEYILTDNSQNIELKIAIKDNEFVVESKS